MKAVFKSCKLIFLVFALLASCLLFSGCGTFEYEGEYPDLCSVAWANIPDLHGYLYDDGLYPEAKVSVLDTDAYGRILFYYFEYFGEGYVSIMQRADGESAYYYPDDCYVHCTPEEDAETPDLHAADIVALKELNDWGLPINESKCEATKIVRKKPGGKIDVDDDFFEEMARRYHFNSGRYIQPQNMYLVGDTYWVASDNYGRELYFVDSYLDEYKPKETIYYEFCFLIVINPDKSYDMSKVILLDDVENPQADMKKIKEQTGWNVAP